MDVCFDTLFKIWTIYDLKMCLITSLLYRPYLSYALICEYKQTVLVLRYETDGIDDLDDDLVLRSKRFTQVFIRSSIYKLSQRYVNMRKPSLWSYQAVRTRYL